MDKPEAGIPPLGKLYCRPWRGLSSRQQSFYDELKSQLRNGFYPDVRPWVSYLFLYADELVRNARCDGFKYTLYALLDLAEAYYETPELVSYCRHSAYDCLLALEQYEEFLELSEPVEPFGADCHRSNLRLNVQYILGRDGLGVDLFRMAEGKVTPIARRHPGIFRELLDRCFLEEAAINGPWLRRTIEKLGVTEPQYEHRLFGLPGLKIFCFYAACEFDSCTKRFRYNFNDVIAECGRKAENVLRDQLGIPRIGEGWIGETTLYHALRDAFPETIIVHHGRPNWLGRQHFDVWFPKWRIAVEYHGPQHFQPVDFFGGAEAYESTVERDKRKFDLARTHGVRLIVVTPDLSHSEVIRQVRAAKSPQMGK
jgi:hypothetical protein